MRRNDLQRIAEIRLREAGILLQNRQYSGAYYLAGYALECALKACITKQVRRYDFPDRKLANESDTHNLMNSVRVAGLDRDLQSRERENSAFAANWALAKDWEVNSRYERHTRRKAQDYYSAIIDSRNGIWRWLVQHW